MNSIIITRDNMRKIEGMFDISKEGNRVFSIFLKDWMSVREASKEYDPEFNKKLKWSDDKEYKNNSTVRKYFNLFQENRCLESRLIEKDKKRVRNGKEHSYPSKCKRFRIDLTGLMINHILEAKKDIKVDTIILLKTIFSDESLRKYLIELFYKILLLQTL